MREVSSACEYKGVRLKNCSGSFPQMTVDLGRLDGDDDVHLKQA